MSASQQDSVVDVIVVGAGGRLGALVVDAARTSSGHRLVGTVRRTAPENADRLPEPCFTDVVDALAGRPASTGRVVVIDLATAGSTDRIAAACAAAGAAYVCATTGLRAEDQAALQAASTSTPVLVAANLSPGAHLVALFAEQAARALPETDIEVVEIHHRHKKDAPSGTALMLAQAAAAGRSTSSQGSPHFVHARDGHAPRQPGDIGVVAVRGGDVVGEHTVSYFGDGERVELVHKVSDRRIFAQGALLAASYVTHAAPGRHEMRDVLRARMG